MLRSVVIGVVWMSTFGVGDLHRWLIGGTRDEVSTREIKLLLLEFVVSCLPCHLELHRCLKFSRHRLPSAGELNPTPFLPSKRYLSTS